MGLFDNMLKDNETIFKNDVALDFSFQPKMLKYREEEQRYMANCISPLLQKRNGKNVLIHGKPGIGKTVAIKHVLQELEEKYDEVLPIYINCWQKNTTYKIVIEMCDVIGYKFTQNKKTEELFKILKNELNKTNIVFVFDEIDKVEEYDFLYSILEEIYRKSIFLISNYKEWLINLDERIKSRLSPELLDFRIYHQQETNGILEQRKEYAFYDNVWENDAFNIVVDKSFELKDIRVGLNLMKESGNIAESESSRKITQKHVELAMKKLDQLTIKDQDNIDNAEEKFILDIVKLNSDKKIGDLYKIYQENNGKSSYKTFQRKIAKLEEGKFIKVKKLEGGIDGNTSIISFQSVKKLTEY